MVMTCNGGSDLSPKAFYRRKALGACGVAWLIVAWQWCAGRANDNGGWVTSFFPICLGSCVVITLAFTAIALAVYGLADRSARGVTLWLVIPSAIAAVGASLLLFRLAGASVAAV